MKTYIKSTPLAVLRVFCSAILCLALAIGLLQKACADTTITSGNTFTINDSNTTRVGTTTTWNDTGTLTIHGGGTLQTSPLQNNTVANHNAIVFAGAGGTITLRFNDNDTDFMMNGVITSSATGAQLLDIYTGFSGNGDRESVTFNNGIPNVGDGSAMSLRVTFRSQTAQPNYVNLKGVNSFTGPITLVRGSGPPTGYFTIGGTLTRNNGNTIGTGTLGSGNYAGNITTDTATIVNYASTATQTLSGIISGPGAVQVTGSGALTLSGVNTFTGNTTVSGGASMTLSNGGGLKFVITDSSTTNNKVTGAGSATLNGNFTVDTSAVTVTSGSWTLVDTTTKSFGGTFGLTGFTGPVGNVYTKTTGGQTWTFNKSTGVLSLSSNAVITSFGIPGSTGVINQTAKTIALTVPYTPWGVSGLATLAPTFTLTTGTCNQTSGSSPSPSFASANPATYTVTDGATVNNYAVTVTITPPSTARAMLTCNFGALGLAAIDEAAGTAVLTVPPSQSVTSLAPTFTLSANATINPAAASTQNFTNSVVYRVTAENGTSFKDYTVSVQTFAAWAYSGSLFIDTTANGANVSGSVTNFPLLLRFSSNNFNFAEAQSDGRDIRFTTVAGAALSYQIEQWDAVNGKAAVWVRIPAIAGNSTQEIVMYWGKSGVSTLSSGSSVFNSSNGYASVHHMSDTLVDTVGTTTPANNSTTASNGLIGRSRTFAAGQGIQCGTSISGLPTGNGPFSTGVWIRTSTFGKALLGWGNQSSQAKVVMYAAAPPRISMDCFFGGAGITGTATVPTAEWVYIVHTYQSTGTRLYLNGVLDASNNGGTMNIPTSSRFDIGGFVPTDGFSFVGEMDEVRISNVVRSADWVKLEYENQKPLQTLVGGIVPSGSNFSVSPTSVTMNEAATTTLTAQAGGARKVYWLYQKNGQETLLATDQLTLNYTAPRVTGNDSATIQFKAVFAGGVQTINVPLTVLDTVPDPVFTLVPSTTPWDGRTTMTVTANISNLAAMQAAGFGTLNYKWTVSGAAVTKQTSNGTLTLTRSQGSGPMTVSLIIGNGGTPVSQSIVINVQEPASDAWVQRTPGATERPVNNQFFARDPNTNMGTIHYNGTEAAPATEVYLKVYTTDTGSDVLYGTHRQTLVGTAYAFAAPIPAGKFTYKVTYGTRTGGVDSAPLATVTNLICGDAFIIEGQSNALATDNGEANAPAPSPWIRSYGKTVGWGNAVNKGSELQLGVWGIILAQRLLADNNIPVCIINGAIGGTRIDVHRPNPANHSLPLGAGYGENSYADLYNRIVGAKLTHGIRAVMWHQGEQDQGSEGPDGDYDYKFYQQYFVDISAAWKGDFPNLLNYYIFQIWPAACGDTSRNDQLREVQRTLPRLYSNMKIVSTHGIVPGSGCHYVPSGYQVFSDLLAPMLQQDIDNYMPAAVFTAANLNRAYFTTATKNEIALEFDQNVAWNSGAPTMLFLANAAGATSGTVSSGSATGNTIKLQVSGASSATSITYLKGLVSWNQADILRGSNDIAALTFADVPIGTLSPYETWANRTFAQAFTDTAATSDPDGDGQSNQYEFAFGLDPTTGSSVNPITQQLDQTTGVFKYTRTANSGLIYKVYYSTNLSAWTLDASANQSPAAAVGGVVTVTVTLAAAAPSDGKLFVRVEATPTP